MGTDKRGRTQKTKLKGDMASTDRPVRGFARDFWRVEKWVRGRIIAPDSTTRDHPNKTTLLYLYRGGGVLLLSCKGTDHSCQIGATNLLQVGVYVGVPGREHVYRCPDLDDVSALGQEGKVQVPHLRCLVGVGWEGKNQRQNGCCCCCCCW